jgi:hypothetical protein
MPSQWRMALWRDFMGAVPPVRVPAAPVYAVVGPSTRAAFELGLPG